MKSFRELIELPDFVTLTGVVSGLLSIFFSLAGKLDIAAILLFLCPAFDWLDGRVAKFIQRKEKAFGGELDNLSDILSFGVAPAFLGYGLGLRFPLSIMVLIIFILCGLLRLARFRVVGIEEGYYQGMTIPTNGYVLPVAYFVMKFLLVPQAWQLNTLLAWYLLSSMLMISSIRWKKII